MLVLCLLCVTVTWTGLMVGNFRLRHPSVYSIDDAGYMLFGRAGREVMSLVLWFFYTLSFGSAVVALSVAFNAFTDDAACTLVWSAMVTAICLFFCTALRSLKSLVWFGYVGVVSIFVAIWIVAIACLAQRRPAEAPSVDASFDKMISAFKAATFASAITAVSAQFFALAGTASFFTIHAEMREPAKWRTSLFLGQSFICLNYIVVAAVVYGRVGQYIASPALGSAGKVIEKVAYGVALPALFFSAVFQVHVSAKYLFVRLLRDTRHLQTGTKRHWITWTLSNLLVVAVGFVASQAIPIYNDLLGLIGALFGTSLCLVLPSLMYLFDLALEQARAAEPALHASAIRFKVHRWLLLVLGPGQQTGPLERIKALLATAITLAGIFLGISATYGSIFSIIETYRQGSQASAFSCPSG